MHDLIDGALTSGTARLAEVALLSAAIAHLFDNPVYIRGAMTLQVLRNQVGDRDFFRILRTWAKRKAGGNGTTAQFIALAERISGQQLDELFNAWLFTAGKPTFGVTTAAAAAATSAARTPPTAASLLQRMSKGASPLRR